MLSKSLIQFSVDNFLCSLPVIYLGPNYGGGNENGPSKGPMQALLHSVPPTLQQPTAKPFLHQRLLDTHGQVWVSVLWGHCSFLLGPGAHKVFLCPPRVCFQSCVSSGGSLVGLMVTSSKRAYAIPRSAFTQSPCPSNSPLLTFTST